MLKKGAWIAVSGVDGAGKTTLSNKIDVWLRKEGKSVYRDRLPSIYNLSKHEEPEQEAYSDEYSKRMSSAIDMKFFNNRLRQKQIEGKYDICLTNGSFLDVFVNGAGIKSYSYEWICNFNCIKTFEKAAIIINLIADGDVAYQRITKKESNGYNPIRRQEFEARKIVEEIQNKNGALSMFYNRVVTLETTNLSEEETFEHVKEYLKREIF